MCEEHTSKWQMAFPRNNCRITENYSRIQPDESMSHWLVQKIYQELGSEAQIKWIKMVAVNLHVFSGSGVIELTTIQAKKQKEEGTKLQWIVEGDPHYHVVDKAFLKLKSRSAQAAEVSKECAFSQRNLNNSKAIESQILCEARIKGRNCCEHDPVGQPKLHSLASEKHVRATCATTSQIRTTTQDTTSRNKRDCSIQRQSENLSKSPCSLA